MCSPGRHLHGPQTVCCDCERHARCRSRSSAPAARTCSIAPAACDTGPHRARNELSRPLARPWRRGEARGAWEQEGSLPAMGGEECSSGDMHRPPDVTRRAAGRQQQSGCDVTAHLRFPFWLRSPFAGDGPVPDLYGGRGGGRLHCTLAGDHDWVSGGPRPHAGGRSLHQLQRAAADASSCVARLLPLLQRGAPPLRRRRLLHLPVRCVAGGAPPERPADLRLPPHRGESSAARCHPLPPPPQHPAIAAAAVPRARACLCTVSHQRPLCRRCRCWCRCQCRSSAPWRRCS